MLLKIIVVNYSISITSLNLLLLVVHVYFYCNHLLLAMITSYLGSRKPTPYVEFSEEDSYDDDDDDDDDDVLKNTGVTKKAPTLLINGITYQVSYSQSYGVFQYEYSKLKGERIVKYDEEAVKGQEISVSYEGKKYKMNVNMDLKRQVLIKQLIQVYFCFFELYIEFCLLWYSINK